MLCYCERYNFGHVNDPTQCYPKVASEIPPLRILDEFGFPIPSAPKASISSEDLELTKRFLKDAQDKTLSRSIHKVLGDLLGRLP